MKTKFGSATINESPKGDISRARDGGKVYTVSMTRTTKQRITYIIGLVVFSLAFLTFDVLAGYNAGIVAQWVVIALSMVISAIVTLSLALWWTR